MRRRFEASEKTRIGDTPLRRAAVRASEASLRAHFASDVGRATPELENPHLEPRVTDAQRANAVPASVLLAIVMHDAEPTVLVTQRHHGISYPGHWVFPGGRADPHDRSSIDTALREAKEEIGLEADRVELLGRLGDYVSHSGFRIVPAVALVHPPFRLVPQPGEVEAIAEISLSRVLDSSSYFLYRFHDRTERAHFALDAEARATSGVERAGQPHDKVPTEPIMLTGVTASICIGLYAALLRTHDRPARASRRSL